jgi:hypothetical protein
MTEEEKELKLVRGIIMFKRKAVRYSIYSEICCVVESIPLEQRFLKARLFSQ